MANNGRDIVAYYLKDINRIPLLTRDEEIALATAAKAGDKKAKDAIIKANLRFVVNVATKYQNNGLDLPDLISEGNVGLLTAIDKFDVSQGYHFISYAVWWIRQAILKAISEKSRSIRLPANRTNDLVKIESARKLVRGCTSEEEELSEIANLANLSKQQVQEILSFSKDIVSIDTTITNYLQKQSTLADYLEDEQNELPEDVAIDNLMQDDINNVLSTLKPREAQVLKLRFGLNGFKPMSLKDVGVKYNLSKERIRQIEKRAIVRMRNPKRKKILEGYIA